MAVTISDNPYLNLAIHIPSDMENFAVSFIYEDIVLFGFLMSDQLIDVARKIE